jgi:hypothetical protein
MNRFIGAVVLIAAVAAGFAFYMGWFHVGAENADGKSNVTLSVDKGKVKEDSHAAVEKVEELGHQIKEKVSGATEETMDGTVVSIGNDKLTMANKEGKEHSHTLVATTKVTCDGKPSTIAELRKGERIRVTTTKDVTLRIEALDKDEEFAKENPAVKAAGITGSK